MLSGEERDATRERAAASVLPLALEQLVYAVRGERLIDDLSLRFDAGRLAVILGPNGAGKSLLLRMAHGLLEPSAGRVCWQGPGASGSAGAQAMVFQRPVLLRRSARANLDWALRVKGVAREERARRIAAVLEATGLEALAARPARRLSAGEQQRLALARAWALEPQVLFLDEPSASLDPAATRRVESLIQRIHDSGTTVIMTTHDLGQARRLAMDVILLHRGRRIESGDAREFFERPSTEEGRAFVQGDLLG